MCIFSMIPDGTTNIFYMLYHLVYSSHVADYATWGKGFLSLLVARKMFEHMGVASSKPPWLRKSLDQGLTLWVRASNHLS